MSDYRDFTVTITQHGRRHFDWKLTAERVLPPLMGEVGVSAESVRMMRVDLCYGGARSAQSAERKARKAYAKMLERLRQEEEAKEIRI